MLVVVSNVDDDGHVTPSWHPERPSRSGAVLAGFTAAGLDDAIIRVAPRPASRDELALVHDPGYLAVIERLCANGGGEFDADTVVAGGSWETASLAAGGGIVACERLMEGGAAAAFVVTRPPGHHASRDQAMGFCVVNTIAVAAAWLADRGERVLIVDWDVHHGNGTQDLFWDDPRVLYASVHGGHLYPGSGRWNEAGGPAARGLTLNVPLLGSTTGDVVLAAFDEVIAPAVERFAPTWVLVSAGFDAHRADPLADLSLTAADFGLLSERVMGFGAPGRVALFLEGGYDLEALAESAAAAAAATLGERYRPQPPSSGGPGRDRISALARRWADGFWADEVEPERS
jgi:acetoin utilization deacetylase AcuC-like enzyme